MIGVAALFVILVLHAPPLEYDPVTSFLFLVVGPTLLLVAILGVWFAMIKDDLVAAGHWARRKWGAR